MSFKNTVIIMTSNLGSAEIFAHVAEGDDAKAEGGKAEGGNGSKASRAALKEKVMEHVRNHFRPGAF